MKANFGARTTKWSLAVLTVLLASQLSGCKSDSNDSEQGEPVATDPDNLTTGETPSIFEGPEVVVGDCDALPLSTTRFSTNAFQPASLSIGAIHEGVVDPDTSGASSNYWEVQLDVAKYIIVAETKTANGDRDNVGVSVNIINNNTDGDTVAVIINEIDYQSRGIAFAIINQPGSYTVSVDPKFGPEEYKILFASGDEQVPYPRFDECRTSSLALSTTEADSLLGRDAPTDADQWYRVDLEAGAYDVESRAVNKSGERTNIGYRVIIYDAYADDKDSLRVSFVNTIAVAAGANDSFTTERGGVFWIRIVNSFGPIDYELTISETEG